MDDNVVTALRDEVRLLREQVAKKAKDQCNDDVVILEGKQYLRIGEAKNPGPVEVTSEDDEDGNSESDDDDPP